MSTTSLVIASSLSSATAFGLLAWVLVPPPRALRSRLSPYLTPTTGSLQAVDAGGPLSVVFGPIVRSAAARLGTLLDRSGSEMTVMKLRQAGWSRGSDERSMLNAYRLAQLKSVAIGLSAGVLGGQLLGMRPIPRMALIVLGLVVGTTRQRGRVSKTIESRRELMRIELYTVNQLLAMRVRAGGGVVQAVTATVTRGRGEVVSELADALRLHRAGWSGADAFRRIAELTPEPFCGRTYRLLAAAEERGADLASALLELSEDVRESRRESIRRSATKRRAAMLIPTIAILAPVLILFVASPLPYLITGWK